jgi:hypothetical protein
MKSQEERLKKQIRGWIIFVGVVIMLSGVTASPAETELRFLLGYSHYLPSFISDWVHRVYTGISEANRQYPFLAYGYDWLAFAHVVIALSLIGPYRDPVRNIWVIDWNMIACVLVFPLALIAGPIRHIPFFHQVIDCCFGLFGLVPLYIIRRKIKRLEGLHTAIG